MNHARFDQRTFRPGTFRPPVSRGSMLKSKYFEEFLTPAAAIGRPFYLAMTYSRLELRRVRPSVRRSVRTSTKRFFSDFDLLWYVGRPRPHMRTNVISTRSKVKVKVKVTELPNLRKVHFSRPVCSAVFACSSKLMIGCESMEPGLQLVGARFSNFLRRKLSRQFKLRRMSIFQ